MSASLRCSRLACPLLLLAVSAACPAAPPEVAVCRPLAREVTDYEDFTGRVEAARTVDLRPRVSGYLTEVHFRPGAMVKEGDLLFEIDPRPYQAKLDRAQAEVAQAEAHLKRLTADFERAKRLLANRGLTAEEYDKIAGEREEAEAALRVAQAARDAARLTLDFTRVTAPMGGKIGQPALDVGNLAVADTTSLARIVSVDPASVFFDVDERTLLRVLRLKLAARGRGQRETETPVHMRLADEEAFPHEGAVSYADNRVDPSTGTSSWRALFPNPHGLLVPGMFARVRLPVGPPHPAVLLPERAAAVENRQAYVFVVNDKDVVERRAVTLGQLQDGLRVIEAGLKDGDRVVADPTAKVRPGMTVAPKLVPIPERPERGKEPPGGGRQP
jgi:RND family efflux transporter MFP subunit